MKHFSLIAAAFVISFAGLHGISNAQTTPQDADARYAQERQKCQTHNTQDSLATCLREVGAARDAARKGQLTPPGAAGAANATDRCDVFQGMQERADCVKRVQSSPASGSVSGGGVLRESVTTTIVPR